MAFNIQLPKLNKPLGSSKSEDSPKPEKAPKVSKAKKLRKGKIPTKRHINVLAKKKQTFSLAKNWPVLALIVLLLIVVGKFLVFDRLAGTLREANRVQTLQTELIEANAKIESMEDLEDVYAHYTISGMTEEELSLVDRVAAMKLVSEAFHGGNVSKSWNLTGNIMTLEVSGPSLSELNLLASELEVDPIVQRCVISSANKHKDESGNVAVTFTIYLQQATETID